MSPAELQQQLDRLGVKPSAAAVRLGVHRSTMTRWLRGQRPIPAYLWRALEHLTREIKRKREA